MDSTLPAKMSSGSMAILAKSELSFDQRLESEDFESQSTSPIINQSFPGEFPLRITLANYPGKFHLS